MLAYVDLRPILFVAGLPLGALLAWGLWRLRGRRRPLGSTMVPVLCVYALAFWFFLAGPFIGRTSTRTFAMTWEPLEADEGAAPGAVRLHFESQPNHYTFVRSAELAALLQSRGRDVVEVEFEVTSDYGRMRGFNVLRVDGWEVPMGAGGGYGVSGEFGASPWD